MKTLSKSITESIIGKRGSSGGIIRKGDLQPGYIVQYRDEFGSLGMYFDYGTAMGIQRTAECKNVLRGEGGFFVLDAPGSHMTLDWMPINRYKDDLTHVDGDNRLDIIAVWPINTQPRLLNHKTLEQLVKGKTPIKINQ